MAASASPQPVSAQAIQGIAPTKLARRALSCPLPGFTGYGSGAARHMRLCPGLRTVAAHRKQELRHERDQFALATRPLFRIPLEPRTRGLHGNAELFSRLSRRQPRADKRRNARLAEGETQQVALQDVSRCGWMKAFPAGRARALRVAAEP